MNNIPTRLFSAQATSASTDPVLASGGVFSVVASGGFGGGTLTIQVSPDSGTTWVSTTLTLTAPGYLNFQPGQGLLVRLTLTGATGATLSAWVAQEF